MSFTSHPWPPPPWMGSSLTQPMHDISSTRRRFSTSLENHRNKPHSIWSLDAPRIISNIFTPELFVILPDCPSFHGLSVGASVRPRETLWRTRSSLADCPPNSRTVRWFTVAHLKLVKFIKDAFELQKLWNKFCCVLWNILYHLDMSLAPKQIS